MKRKVCMLLTISIMSTQVLVAKPVMAETNEISNIQETNQLYEGNVEESGFIGTIGTNGHEESEGVQEEDESDIILEDLTETIEDVVIDELPLLNEDLDETTGSEITEDVAIDELPLLNEDLDETIGSEITEDVVIDELPLLNEDLDETIGSEAIEDNEELLDDKLELLDDELIVEDYIVPEIYSNDTAYTTSFDPNHPPLFYQRISDDLVPEGWEQYYSLDMETGNILYWSFRPKSLARSVVQDVYINIGTVMSSEPGYTFANDVITLTGGNHNYVITGSTSKTKIEVESGVTATVVLRGVTMSAVLSPISLKSEANLTVYLPDNYTNSITSSDAYSAGILAPSNTSLTIDGAPNGVLSVKTTGAYGAAIGGNGAASGNGIDGGNITINNGKINATSDAYGAGIGGGGVYSNGSAGNGGVINIVGGTVVSTSGSHGAGIGGGGITTNGPAGNGGVINIVGGKVVSTAGTYGAAIGGGGGTGSATVIYYSGSGGIININNTNLTAKSQYGATIGGGGGNYYQGGSGDIINIDNSSVSATSSYGAGIGGGSSSNHFGGDGGAITINGRGNNNIITSTGFWGTGIGAGYGAKGGGASGHIDIKNAIVYAYSTAAAGIGRTINSPVDEGSVSISGGVVRAYSRNVSAILSSNLENKGDSYIVNGYLKEALSSTITELKAINVEDQADFVGLTLPASYRGFAFNVPNDNVYNIVTNVNRLRKSLSNSPFYYDEI
jgi:hypothetical protein